MAMRIGANNIFKVKFNNDAFLLGIANPNNLWTILADFLKDFKLKQIQYKLYTSLLTFKKKNIHSIFVFQTLNSPRSTYNNSYNLWVYFFNSLKYYSLYWCVDPFFWMKKFGLKHYNENITS